jgi:imidazoleglycerol-phosphate dehydratase/histidinol-phosphatase
MKQKILFIDRDGTLNVEPADNQVDSLEKVRLVEGVMPALLQLKSAGYRFIMVSNQDGLGTDSFPREQFELCHRHIVTLFSTQGIEFDEEFICPHFDDDRCDCRKPRTGLLTAYLARTTIDMESSAVIGDRQTDLQLADNLGIRGFLVDPARGGEFTWDGIRAALLSAKRTAHVERKTRETAIEVSVNLDETAPIAVSTGIGFYDHMLEQIAPHHRGHRHLSWPGPAFRAR